MHKYLLLSFFVFGFASEDFAQKNYVKVNKDIRMDLLSNKMIEINERAKKLSKRRNYRGYRLQVFNGSNRDEANNVKAEMLRRFPELGAYLLYQAPNFRIRVGNFLTQKEAGVMRKKLADFFPGRGIFIVPDKIDYTPPDDED